MRDLWVFLAVVLGALGVGVLGDGENWFGDRVVLVEISYLFGVLMTLGTWRDIRSARKRR